MLTRGMALSMGAGAWPDKRRSTALRGHLDRQSGAFHVSYIMSVADRIRDKLAAALQPTRLAIRDDSHRHRGHAGSRPEGETHFHVEIVAAAFRGESRVSRQRRVYALLAEELSGPVHALALSTLTPEEDEQK
jgi:BolA protein